MVEGRIVIAAALRHVTVDGAGKCVNDLHEGKFREFGATAEIFIRSPELRTKS